jgi:hypothetical protein
VGVKTDWGRRRCRRHRARRLRHSSSVGGGQTRGRAAGCLGAAAAARPRAGAAVAAFPPAVVVAASTAARNVRGVSVASSLGKRPFVVQVVIARAARLGGSAPTVPGAKKKKRTCIHACIRPPIQTS